MKKQKTVIDAEVALSAKEADVAAAKEALKRAEDELSAAYAAVRQAQTDADAGLPQCRMVRVRWRSGKEEGGANYVIVRRTPGGMLVVRRVGGGHELKFKWAEHSGKFWQAEKAGLAMDTNELRDVPAEYLPTCPTA